MKMRILPALALCALLLAACGSSRSGSIPRAAAQRLAAESDRVAARLQVGDGCGAAALARRLVRDAAPFPQARASAAALAAEITCVPPAPAAAPPAPVAGPSNKHEHKNGHKKHRKERD
jgi:hypothetical protein